VTVGAGGRSGLVPIDPGGRGSRSPSHGSRGGGSCWVYPALEHCQCQVNCRTGITSYNSFPLLSNLRSIFILIHYLGQLCPTNIGFRDKNYVTIFQSRTLNDIFMRALNG